MGLIARELEARGIATVGLSSALSITTAVRQPRAVYLDFPLGHTAGRTYDRALQRRVLLTAFDLLSTAREAEAIVHLGDVWASDDAWKDRIMLPRKDKNGALEYSDTRVERHATLQYQTAADASAAAQAPDCPTCVYL